LSQQTQEITREDLTVGTRFLAQCGHKPCCEHCDTIETDKIARKDDNEDCLVELMVRRYWAGCYLLLRCEDNVNLNEEFLLVSEGSGLYFRGIGWPYKVIRLL